MCKNNDRRSNATQSSSRLGSSSVSSNRQIQLMLLTTTSDHVTVLWSFRSSMKKQRYLNLDPFPFPLVPFLSFPLFDSSLHLVQLLGYLQNMNVLLMTEVSHKT